MYNGFCYSTAQHGTLHKQRRGKVCMPSTSVADVSSFDIQEAPDVRPCIDSKHRRTKSIVDGLGDCSIGMLLLLGWLGRCSACTVSIMATSSQWPNVRKATRKPGRAKASSRAAKICISSADSIWICDTEVRSFRNIALCDTNVWGQVGVVWPQLVSSSGIWRL